MSAALFRLTDYLEYHRAHFGDAPLGITAGQLLTVLQREAQEEADSTAGTFEWLNTGEAARRTGVNERTLRSRAAGWYELQDRGRAPEIRVRKASAAENAPWQFHAGDCAVYAHRNGHVPQPAPAAQHQVTHKTRHLEMVQDADEETEIAELITRIANR